MKALFDELDELVLICDKMYTILFTNKKFLKTFGGELQDWRNHKLQDKLPQWPTSEVKGKNHEPDLRFNLSTGQHINWHKKEFLQTDYSLFLGRICQNEINTSFLQAVLHEAHGPLSGVEHLLLLLAETDLTPYQANCIHVIEDAVHSSINLLHDALDSKNMGEAQNQKKTVPKDVGLISTVRSVIELLNPRANRLGTEIAAYYHPELPSLIRCDDIRLKRLLFNLISECLSYSACGVLVSVNLEDSPTQKETNQKDSLEQEEGSASEEPVPVEADIVFHICNPDSDRKYLEPLEREFNNNQAPWVVIVKRLIIKLKGQIELGYYETGTGFQLRIPLLTIQPTQGLQEKNLKGRHLCILSKSLALSKGLALQAKSYGAEVLEVNSRKAFAEVLHKVKKEELKPDILLIETGNNFAIEERIDTFPIKLALLKQTKRDQSIEDIFDGYLITPIRVETLITRITAAETAKITRDKWKKEQATDLSHQPDDRPALIEQNLENEKAEEQIDPEGQKAEEQIDTKSEKVEEQISREQKSTIELETAPPSPEISKTATSKRDQQEEEKTETVEKTETTQEAEETKPFDTHEHNPLSTIQEEKGKETEFIKPEKKEITEMAQKHTKAESSQITQPLSSSKIPLSNTFKSKKNPKILVAEDNALNALLVKTFLEYEGCEVIIAEDGILALEAFEKDEFDLVFLDMRMPKMDGLEVARRIRSMNSIKSEKPLVALTANAFEEDRQACLNAGMDDFLTKPVDSERLTTIIEKWLQIKNNPSHRELSTEHKQIVN